MHRLLSLPLLLAACATSIARACVAMWDGVLPGSRLTAQVNALKPAAKRCMVAQMFRTCVLLLEDLEDIKSKEGVVVLAIRRTRAKLRQGADDFTLEACKAPLTDEQVRLLEKLRAAINKDLK